MHVDVTDVLSTLTDEEVEHFDEDSLPDYAFQLALDVARKRRTYLMKKRCCTKLEPVSQKTDDVPKKSEGDAKRKAVASVKSAEAFAKRKAAAKKKSVVCSYTCSQCFKSLCKKDECFPLGSHDSDFKYCEECFQKNDTIMKQYEEESQEYRRKNKKTMSPLKKKASIKKAAAAAKTASRKKINAVAKKKVITSSRKKTAAKRKTAAVKKKTAAAEKKSEAASKNTDTAAAKKKTAAVKKKTAAAEKKSFELNDNVLAKYGRNWYAAQIFKVRGGGKYDVYFPEDRTILTTKYIKSVSIPVPYWARMTRDDFVSMTFSHALTKDAEDCGCDQHEPGEYIIKSMGRDEHVNKYICNYVSRRKTTGIERTFDMGYVQRILLKDVFPFGPDSEN